MNEFTLEEKALTIFPCIFVLMDYFATFLISGEPSLLLLHEYNVGVKLVVAYGTTGVFSMIVLAVAFTLLFSYLVMLLVKKHNLNIKYGYALIFFYAGYRCAGAASWFVVGVR
jgi:hypothetical protein